MRGSSATEKRSARKGRARMVLRAGLRLLGSSALLASLSLSLGCGEVVPFHCSDDSQCVSDSAGQGSCEPDGFCAFPDDSCETGRRYGKHAPEDRSEMCVPLCIQEIALGELHGCMRLAGGTVQCWGDNAGFKLGQEENEGDHIPPSPVEALRNVTGLGAGESHSCAISGEDGRVLCWGQNMFGQLGSQPPLGSAKPLEVRFGSSAVLKASEVDGGRAHTCARTEFLPGTVICWGANEDCQLDTGSCTPEASSPPVMTSAPANLGVVRDLSLGGDNSCAMFDDNRAACWGANDVNQLCRPGMVALMEPDGAIDAVDHSGQLGCVASGDVVQCCGDNGFMPVAIGVQVSDLAAGEAHLCALAEGRVFCGGDNQRGQLGQGDLSPRQDPVEVLGLPPIVQLDARGSYTCALAADGQLLCWGDNVRGQVDPFDTAETIATPTATLTGTVSCLPAP